MNMIAATSMIANPGDAANDSGSYWRCYQPETQETMMKDKDIIS